MDTRIATFGRRALERSRAHIRRAADRALSEEAGGLPGLRRKAATVRSSALSALYQATGGAHGWFLGRVGELRGLQVEFEAAEVRDDPRVFSRAADALRCGGAIVLRGYYSSSQVDRLRRQLDPLLEDLEGWRRKDPRTSTDGRFLIQNDLGRWLKGYGGCVKHPKPVVNFRSGPDDGLVDVFHPERLFPEGTEGVDLADPEREGLVISLLQAALGKQMESKVRNIYVNDSVQQTRDFHVDGYATKAKSFVYLSDVETTGDGPYCYVLGTHRARPSWRRANRKFNEHARRRWDDFPLHGPRTRRVFLGRRGDLVLSLQYGAHRGLPQAVGRRRLVLVHTVAQSR